jgi:uncharacterized membrane protein YoaK (UPF0700 family)
MPSWLLLAGAGGAVNTIAFVACSRFVSHVTGTVSRLGMDVRSPAQSALWESVIVFGALILGAMSSSVIARRPGKEAASYARPLFVVAALLTTLGALGTTGIFGAVDGLVDGPRCVLFLSFLAFAMGLQNASVATSTSLMVRTTHITGPATDLAVHLATAMRATGPARVLALRHVSLRAGTIAGFTAGAGVGAWLAARFAFQALYFPAGAIVVAAWLSFVDAQRVDASTPSGEGPALR